MPRFSANLSMLYPELPFMERFGAAAADAENGHWVLRGGTGWSRHHPAAAIGRKPIRFPERDSPLALPRVVASPTGFAETRRTHRTRITP